MKDELNTLSSISHSMTLYWLAILSVLLTDLILMVIKWDFMQIDSLIFNSGPLLKHIVVVDDLSDVPIR